MPKTVKEDDADHSKKRLSLKKEQVSVQLDSSGKSVRRERPTREVPRERFRDRLRERIREVIRERLRNRPKGADAEKR